MASDSRHSTLTLPRALYAYIAVLAAAAATLGYLVATTGPDPPGAPSWPALPVLAGLLVGAEYLFVRFRYQGEINALNLMEAVLMPLLFAFHPGVVVVTVAASQIIGGILRRNAPVKAAFNVAQWTLAAAAGATVVGALGTPGLSRQSIGALLAALALVGLMNQVAFTSVISIANRRPVKRLLRDLAPVIVPGWLTGWVLNTLVGLLFVFAYAAHPAAVVLFPVPLAVLHLAYRGYAGVRSDRVRLAGLHRAAEILADPLDPADAIAPYLQEVARSFEANAAMLVLRGDGHRVVYTIDAVENRSDHYIEDDAAPTLAAVLLAHPRAMRIRVADGGPAAEALDKTGARDCLSAPLLIDGLVMGVLMVLDQAGLEGFEAGELAVLESLARETAATLSKGRLLKAILDEQRMLTEIVTSASDGIFTLSPSGIVQSWNPAMERITGLRATDVIGFPGALSKLSMRAADGSPVSLENWVDERERSSDVVITSMDGAAHRLSCSYSSARNDDGSERTLVVIARDVTRDEEIRQLRKAYGRLAQAEAAHRSVVEQLQQAVMPLQPTVDGAELGVAYLASDPTAPTGGDLYDWQLLPDGEVHIAVVDVLGHGVAATRDALSVVHALRMLALDGCPLLDMIGRADELLSAQNPDLVATVIVARYDPARGRASVVGGGHPPALHVSRSSADQIAAPGGAIGWPGAGSRDVATVDLRPGDSLIFYTDGLVEARKDIIEGTESLIRHARRFADEPAEVLAAHLVDAALAESDRRDDSLALVLRRTPVGALESRWSSAPDPRQARSMRQSFARWLAEHHLPVEVAEDMELVAAELISNAVTAARTSIAMRAVLDGDELTMEVEDDGAGRPDLSELGHKRPSSDADAGRGLLIVRGLTDDVDIISTVEGTIVRCVRRVRVSAAEPRGSISADR